MLVGRGDDCVLDLRLDVDIVKLGVVVVGEGVTDDSGEVSLVT
jgi:hypothetical protein